MKTRRDTDNLDQCNNCNSSLPVISTVMLQINSNKCLMTINNNNIRCSSRHSNNSRTSRWGTIRVNTSHPRILIKTISINNWINVSHLLSPCNKIVNNRIYLVAFWGQKEARIARITIDYNDLFPKANGLNQGYSLYLFL